MSHNTTGDVSKAKLLQFVKELLSVDDLNFLIQLEQRDLEHLVVAIRARVERGSQSR